MPADEIRKRIGDDTWRTYYKFCSVRNPFDKVVSKYNSVRSSRQGFIAGTLRGQIASLSRATLQLDFERFVHTVKSDRDKYVIDGEFCLDGVIFSNTSTKTPTESSEP